MPKPKCQQESKANIGKLVTRSKALEQKNVSAIKSGNKSADKRPKNNAALAPVQPKEGIRGAAISEDQVLNIRKAISVLSSLVKPPASPSPDVLPTVVECNAASWPPSPLPLATEQTLVELFTFLVSKTDDPDKVAALCLESHLESGHAIHRLKIAANHGDLEPVKLGLEDIFLSVKQCRAKSQARNDQWPQRKGPCHTTSELDVVLHKILTLHCNRVLCRLRSCHAKSKGFSRMRTTRPILTQLFAVYDKQQHQFRTPPAFHESLELLRGLISSFERLPSFDIKSPPASVIVDLAEIVKTIHHLWHTDGFCAHFDSELSLMRLSKVSRYMAATSFLVQNEEVHGILDSVTVQIVRLPPIPTSEIKDTSRCLMEFVSQLPLPGGSVQPFLDHSSSTQGRSPLVTKSAFVEVTNSKCAVHAEIQLLFEYELHGYRGSPRLIASTKMPCFLCALFFAVHGRFQMAKSHGRLYDKWTFPDALTQLKGPAADSMAAVLRRFFDALSACIAQALLHSPSRKIASTESFFRHSSVWARASRALVVNGVSQHSLKSATTVHLAGPNLLTRLGHLRASTTALAHGFMDFLRLARGGMVVFPLSPHALPETTVRTKAMRLHFAHENNNEGLPDHKGRNLLVKIHSLLADGSHTTPHHQVSGQVVEVDTLKRGEEIVIKQTNSSAKGFYVVHRDELLLLQIQEASLSSVDT
ncbi:hypothetical protein OHC33_004507 [Knufia fluminis]|uniref:Uncharacterized protein n=1 Tax=Knufia fluminis TaxID=191047 RepID=A0AAN8EVP3_9EURO|nr:hypothetical protein OHC33_004507 [Knufia fluminis]